MTAAVRDYLPWLLSAITIWMTLLAGNKHPSAWLVGLGNQLLWLVWIVVTGTWGLIPLNIALWVVYGRNHLKWRQAESAHKAIYDDEVTAEQVAATDKLVAAEFHNGDWKTVEREIGLTV